MVSLGGMLPTLTCWMLFVMGGGDVTTYYPSSWCMYAYYYYYYMMARNSKGTDGGQRQLTNPVVVKV